MVDSSIKSELRKTDLCRTFEQEGDCPYGERCHFAHGSQELRSREEIMKKHIPNFRTAVCRNKFEDDCPYGPKCAFIHLDPNDQSALTSAEEPVLQD